ncbi:MAG: DUF2891 domain-containing protein [Erythrobacter sp.]|nr:DUF2891 domain-containing protein [Erythrobacter sp.]
MELTPDLASSFARIALGHLAREYPHKLDHVMAGDADVLSPQRLHPVFFGSFDWHSCVHGWWTLLTLRRLYPDMPEAREIEALAEETFTGEKLAVELAYLERPESRGFERPYGWGWLLYLHHEAARHGDREWGARLEPLARAFADRFGDYLRVLTYPITVGTHFNTAFALVLAREWAELRDAKLLATIDEWSFAAFGQKRFYDGWEPGGDEFLSPVLTSALLMSGVMPHSQFAPWFEDLVLANGWLERECRPVTVSDRSDGKIAHLDGLNFSRAWCLRETAKALGEHASLDLMETRARDHLIAALGHVEGDYMGEHWLASFALLALRSR